MTEFLQELFGENLDEQLKDRLLEEIQNRYIAKEDFDSLNLELNSLKEQDQERQNSFNQEVAKMKIQNSLDNAMEKYGAKNLKAVGALIDPELIQIDEFGKVTGIDEQMELLLKSDSFLFEQKGVRGLKPAEASDTSFKSPKNMGYEELCEFFKTKRK